MLGLGVVGGADRVGGEVGQAPLGSVAVLVAGAELGDRGGGPHDVTSSILAEEAD